MIMEWNETFAVGEMKIDNQHKELFDRINILLTAMKDGKGKEEVIKTLEFLENYVIKHFNDEEEIQKKSNYPKYEEQHREHEEFKKELTRLRNIFETQGISTSLVIQTQKKMSEWWKMHITKLDKDLGKHLVENKIKL